MAKLKYPLSISESKSIRKPPGSPVFRRAKREVLTGKKTEQSIKKVDFYVKRHPSESDDDEIELVKV